MKNYKILFFLFIIFLVPNTYALDYNVTNTITSPVAPSNEGTYTGVEQNGATSSWNVNTRYQGTLQRIRFNIPKPSSIEGDCYWSNMTYKITMNMATNDWRNRFGTVRVVPYSSYSGNWSNGKVTFVSMKKIYFTFKIPSSYTSCNDFVYIDLPSNATFTPFTGDTNWNLQSIILSDEVSSGGGSSGGSTPTPTPDNTDKIIDNQKQNTQDIINNNNNNTSDIIENNNNNTQEIKDTIQDNLNNCRNSYNIINPDNLTTGGISTETGELGYGFFIITSDYIPIDNDNTHYSFRYNTYASPQIVVFKYGSTHNFLGFDVIDNSSGSLSIASNVKFLRLRFSGDFDNSFNFQAEPGPTVHPYEQFGSKVCSSKIDDVSNSVNDVNNSINNSNIENGVGNSFFDNFSNNMHGLSSIITIPLSSIQSLADSQCTPLHFPIPFTNNKYLDVPCMTEIYQQHIPTLLTLIQTCWYGILAYKVLVNIFGIVKGFKDPDSDKIEVMDL